MITEGIGQTAPQRVPIVMTWQERMMLFRDAKRIAEKYKSRSDAWGQGLKPALSLPGMGELASNERAFYVGLVGEYAVQRYVGNRFPIADSKCVVDTSLYSGGDFGVDLTAFGLKMQVKTRQKMATETLFKRAKNDKRLFSINAHVCVFCQWLEDSQTTWILGWCWAATVLELPLLQSPFGHWNVEVPDDALLPMCALHDELSAWRAAQQWH